MYGYYPLFLATIAGLMCLYFRTPVLFLCDLFQKGKYLRQVCGIDSKQSTGADALNPGLLLLAAPLIVNIFF